MDRNAISLTVLGLGILVFLGYLLAGLFRKTRIPDVLILTLMGLLIGPQVLHWAAPAQFGVAGPVFTTIALLVILFDGGFHLPLSAMRQGLHETLALTFLAFLMTVAIGTAVALPILGNWVQALFVGMALANTSAAVVLPVMRSLGLSAAASAALATESVVTDILCIVGALSVLQVMGGSEYSIGHIAFDLGRHVLVSAVLGLMAGLFWRTLMGYVERIPHAMLAEFAFVFILYGLCELLGGSGPAAVLMCALLIANLPQQWLDRHTPSWLNIVHVSSAKTTLFSEVAFLVKVFFFIYLGLSIHITDYQAMWPGAMIVIALFFLRIPLARWFLPKSCPRSEAAITASLAPKGLVSAVLAMLPAQQGIAGAEAIQTIIFPTILVSLVAASLLIPLQNLRWSHLIMGKLFPHHAPTSDVDAKTAAAAPAPSPH